jgi:uncharacterized membrane protein YccC
VRLGSEEQGDDAERPQHRGARHIGTLSAQDAVYALNMAVACLLSYWLMTATFSRLADEPSRLLDGMWAVVATVFVFRDSRAHALSAGVSRLVATCVSIALCWLYLSWFAFTPIGMAALIGIGTVIMTAANRREDIVTTGITTAVVMVVAAMSPGDASRQPLLRLVDTVVGIAVGVACKWVGSSLYFKATGATAR